MFNDFRGGIVGAENDRLAHGLGLGHGIAMALRIGGQDKDLGLGQVIQHRGTGLMSHEMHGVREAGRQAPFQLFHG